MNNFIEIYLWERKSIYYIANYRVKTLKSNCFINVSFIKAGYGFVRTNTNRQDTGLYIQIPNPTCPARKNP